MRQQQRPTHDLYDIAEREREEEKIKNQKQQSTKRSVLMFLLIVVASALAVYLIGNLWKYGATKVWAEGGWLIVVVVPIVGLITYVMYRRRKK